MKALPDNSEGICSVAQGDAEWRGVGVEGCFLWTRSPIWGFFHSSFSPVRLPPHLDLRLCSENLNQLPTLQAHYLTMSLPAWEQNHTQKMAQWAQNRIKALGEWDTGGLCLLRGHWQENRTLEDHCPDSLFPRRALGGRSQCSPLRFHFLWFQHWQLHIRAEHSFWFHRTSFLWTGSRFVILRWLSFSVWPLGMPLKGYPLACLSLRGSPVQTLSPPVKS